MITMAKETLKFLEPSLINVWINPFDKASLALRDNNIFRFTGQPKTIMHNMKSIRKARTAVTKVSILLVMRIQVHSPPLHLISGGWPPVPQTHPITKKIRRETKANKIIDNIFITLWHLLDNFCA